MNSKLVNQWIELEDGWEICVGQPYDICTTEIRVCKKYGNEIYNFHYEGRDFLKQEKIIGGEILLPLLTVERIATHPMNGVYRALATALNIAGIKPFTTDVDTMDSETFSKSAWVGTLEKHGKPEV